MDGIGYAKHGHVGTLSLQRPDKLNAQTPQMWLDLAELGAEVCADPELRVLVVAGEGRSFSAGIDITAFTGGGSGGDGASRGPSMGSADDIQALQAGFTWLEEAPFLTVAKVQGHALGAGMQLALACDVRIVADDCQMGLLETRWGLMPDLGGTVWLPRLIGPARALELMVTAQRLRWLANALLRAAPATPAARPGPRLRADALLDLGIVNRVVARDELDAAVDAFVAQVVAQPPLAVRGAKAAVRAGWGRDTATGMRAAAEAQMPCITSRDFGEAARAFLEGRPPVYEGR
jgi:enoyl-CoA hydratase/carnithine racemase